MNSPTHNATTASNILFPVSSNYSSSSVGGMGLRCTSSSTSKRDHYTSASASNSTASPVVTAATAITTTSTTLGDDCDTGSQASSVATGATSATGFDSMKPVVHPPRKKRRRNNPTTMMRAFQSINLQQQQQQQQLYTQQHPQHPHLQQHPYQKIMDWRDIGPTIVAVNHPESDNDGVMDLLRAATDEQQHHHLHPRDCPQNCTTTSITSSLEDDEENDDEDEDEEEDDVDDFEEDSSLMLLSDKEEAQLKANRKVMLELVFGPPESVGNIVDSKLQSMIRSTLRQSHHQLRLSGIQNRNFCPVESAMSSIDDMSVDPSYSRPSMSLNFQSPAILRSSSLSDIHHHRQPPPQRQQQLPQQQLTQQQFDLQNFQYHHPMSASDPMETDSTYDFL